MSSDTDEAARAVWRLMFDLLIETNPPRQAVLARHGLTPNDSRARRALVRAGAADTGRLRARMTTAHRAAAGLLAITVICMVIARFF